MAVSERPGAGRRPRFHHLAGRYPSALETVKGQIFLLRRDAFEYPGDGQRGLFSSSVGALSERPRDGQGTCFQPPYAAFRAPVSRPNEARFHPPKGAFRAPVGSSNEARYLPRRALTECPHGRQMRPISIPSGAFSKRLSGPFSTSLCRRFKPFPKKGEGLFYLTAAGRMARAGGAGRGRAHRCLN